MKIVILEEPTKLIANIPNSSIIIRADKEWITWLTRRSKINVYDVSTCETNVFECQNDTESCQLTKDEIKKIAIAVGFKIK